jgi:hypothetical protein
MFMDGVFKVQVDDFKHAWSHGWHETPMKDWEKLSEEDWNDDRRK